MRIFDPLAGGLGNLDLFTSSNAGGNETHIVFGQSGQISGQANRFEFLSNITNGFYFNNQLATGMFKFATNSIVHALVGNNRFWRIGDQTELANISATRRLEVVENNWQFRLSRTNGNFTDFQTNANGNLQVLPQNGRVGINLNSNPTANLDVNGNARIRNVQAATPNSLLVGVNANGASDVHVRRLDFTGDADDVLLGDGTWGTAPGSVLANNGTSAVGNTVQLGGACNNFWQLLFSSFTSSRAIFLKGNSFWMFSGATQSGGIGFGAQPASAGLCGV